MSFTPRMSWRERLMAEGEAPDPRLSLANERTFLAWTRTALAMIAGGVGIEAFAGDAIPAWVRILVACALLAIGAILAAGSFLRWRNVEMAMRRGDALTVSVLAPFVAAGVAVVALGLMVAVLLRQ
ncbi:MAG: YidH family protein [Marmoricola sp.]